MKQGEDCDTVLATYHHELPERGSRCQDCIKTSDCITEYAYCTDQRDVNQRLIQRGDEMTEAVDTLAVSQSLRECRAKRQADVLIRVVVIDVRVTL